jgi:hypothetical protein
MIKPAEDVNDAFLFYRRTGIALLPFTFAAKNFQPPMCRKFG